MSELTAYFNTSAARTLCVFQHFSVNLSAVTTRQNHQHPSGHCLPLPPPPLIKPHWVLGDSEGGDPMGGVTPPPPGEGPPHRRSTCEMIPLPLGGRGPPCDHDRLAPQGQLLRLRQTSTVRNKWIVLFRFWPNVTAVGFWECET
jgi:hypothetical protein